MAGEPFNEIAYKAYEKIIASTLGGGGTPNADGSIDIGGLNNTSVATLANPFPVTGPSRNEYEFVAASQPNQVLGAGAGAVGDYCEHLLVIPLTTSPGNVQLKDGAGTAMTVFAGGASSVTSLVPFNIYVGAASVAGAWQVTTGANVQVIAAGNYT